MIRLIVTSVGLFLIQVALFCSFSPAILDRIAAIDINLLTFTAKQRRVIHNIQRQHDANLQSDAAVFVLGGSTSREFFYDDGHMAQLIGRSFVNLGASRQTLIDSLRLADNIHSENATVIYCLYPMKFMRFSNTVPSESRYQMGAYLKYPVASTAVDELLTDVPPRNLAMSLLQEFNVYCYLLKNYLLEKNFTLQQMLAGLRPFSVAELFVAEQLPVQHFYHQRAYDRNRLAYDLLTVKKEIGDTLEPNLQNNFALLSHLVDLVHQRGKKVVLLELPYSATFQRMFQKELSVYRTHLDAFLQAHPIVPFKRIAFDVYRGRETLFYDHGHLLDGGRRFFYPHVEHILKKDVTLAANR